MMTGMEEKLFCCFDYLFVSRPHKHFNTNKIQRFDYLFVSRPHKHVNTNIIQPTTVSLYLPPLPIYMMLNNLAALIYTLNMSSRDTPMRGHPEIRGHFLKMVAHLPLVKKPVRIWREPCHVGTLSLGYIKGSLEDRLYCIHSPAALLFEMKWWCFRPLFCTWLRLNWAISLVRHDSHIHCGCFSHKGTNKGLTFHRVLISIST